MEKITFQDINEAFKHLQDYAKKYQQTYMQSQLEKVIQPNLKLDYKIAIVGNMSAGKSTFINALFGEEILPAFNHATTDSATFIYSTNEKSAMIHFDNGKTFMLPYDDHRKFIRELMQYGQKDEECNDNKHKNVKRIDLYYPFKGIYTQNAGEMNIIFVDTPGPNATGDYAEKHKDQTRSVLNDVDLALFLFDYEQLDTNLYDKQSDKQGLWDTIKERHDKDKDFEVFFVLNKIDMAFEDNATSKSEWFYHEQKAIDKLKNAAIAHGISDPQIYPVSSLYALLQCKVNKDYDDEDKLEFFEKKFERKFDDEWEDELIQYLGIDRFTESINKHIEYKPQKRLDDLVSTMRKMIESECNRVNGEIELMRIPDKEKVKGRLLEAQKFLERRMPETKRKLNGKLDEVAEYYMEQIKKTIDRRIQKDMLNQIETIVKKALIFVEFYSSGSSEAVSKRNAINVSKVTLAEEKLFHLNISKLPQEIGELSEEDRNRMDNELEAEVDNKINQTMSKMQNFIQEMLNDCKRDYTNIRSDIRKIYREMETDKHGHEEEARELLEQGLDKQLELQSTRLNTQSIDIDSMLSFDTEIPDSVLDYHFKEADYKEVSTAKWWNPFSWFDSKLVKTKNEKLIININGIELKNAIERQVQDNVKKLKEAELQNHEDNIAQIHENAKNLFAAFIEAKKEQIKRLDLELDDIARREKIRESKEVQLQNLQTNLLYHN